MSSLFDIVIGGTAASDFDANIVELEVEENADLPGAFSITLPVNAPRPATTTPSPIRGWRRCPTSPSPPRRPTGRRIA